jgi:anti-sigma B factor antagonist
MSLVISVLDEGPPAVIELVGEIDLSTAPELLDAALARIDAGISSLVLDLDGVTFCDSAGLSAFVRLKKRAVEAGGGLALARPASIVRSVLELTGLAELIPVLPTVAQARTAALDQT